MSKPLTPVVPGQMTGAAPLLVPPQLGGQAPRTPQTEFDLADRQVCEEIDMAITGPTTYPDRPTYPGGPVYPSPGTAQQDNPDYHPNTNPTPAPAATPEGPSTGDQESWDKWQQRVYNTRHGLNEDGSDPNAPSPQKPGAPSPAPGKPPAAPGTSDYPWWADPAKNPADPLNLPTFEAPKAGLDMDLQNQIDGYLKDVLSGQNKRFSPETLQQMKDQVFTATEGGRKKAVDQANSDALHRGLFRSGIPIDAQMQAQSDASSAYSKGVTDINTNAANAEYDDKMAALDRAEKSLTDKRTYLLGLDHNSMERTIGEAQLRLESAKIAAAKNQLDRDMSSKYDINQSNEQLQRDLATQQAQLQRDLAAKNAELQKWIVQNTPRSGGGSSTPTILDLPPLGPAPVF
jgi:hypothetical protein